MAEEIRMRFGKFDGDALITVEEFSALICSNRLAVYKQIKRGNAPRVMHYGRHMRFRVADVREWLVAMATASEAHAAAPDTGLKRMGRPRVRKTAGQ